MKGVYVCVWESVVLCVQTCTMSGCMLSACVFARAGLCTDTVLYTTIPGKNLWSTESVFSVTKSRYFQLVKAHCSWNHLVFSDCPCSRFKLGLWRTHLLSSFKVCTLHHFALKLELHELVSLFHSHRAKQRNNRSDGKDLGSVTWYEFLSKQ